MPSAEYQREWRRNHPDRVKAYKRVLQNDRRGYVGVVRHPRGQAPESIGTINSYCMICGSWFYGRHLPTCFRCGNRIMRQIPTNDLFWLEEERVS